MDFFLYILEHAISSGIASIPLIVVFLQLKIFKLSPKAAAYCLLLNLTVSIFFWVKLRDISLAIYQSVSYVSSFIWILSEHVLRKRKENSRSEGDLD